MTLREIVLAALDSLRAEGRLDVAVVERALEKLGIDPAKVDRASV